MNTSSAEQRNAAPNAGLPHTLDRGEVERRVKAAVQSGSPEQVESFDPALLVGCVDWYQYDTAPEAARPH